MDGALVANTKRAEKMSLSDKERIDGIAFQLSMAMLDLAEHYGMTGNVSGEKNKKDLIRLIERPRRGNAYYQRYSEGLAMRDKITKIKATE